MIALFVVAALQAGAPDPAYRINPDRPVADVTAERCRAVARRYVQDLELRGRPRNLGELPPGVLMHAVLKTVDGCAVNVLVERGPDGRKLEVPAGAGAFRNAPAADRSGAQRRQQRRR